MAEQHILEEIRNLLDEYGEAGNHQNKEMVALVRELVKRIEPLEHEIFNSEGSLNQIQKAMEEVERYIDEQKEKKFRWKRIWDGALTKALGWGLTVLLGALGAYFFTQGGQ